MEHADVAAPRRSSLAPLPGAPSPPTTLVASDVASALRPEIVRVVQHQVRAGTYRPQADDVAELLLAWLFLGRSRAA